MAEITIVTKIGEAIISTASDVAIDSVWRQIGYVWSYKSNFQDLNKQLARLKDERKSILHKKDAATRNGELIEDTVTNWLESADEAIGVAEQIIEDCGRANKSCFIGCCPNLKTRYQFSRKAKKLSPVIAQVQGDGSSITDISYLPYVQELQLVGDSEALESRTQVLNGIVGALKNADFNLIGVYGMPGVGKTTLVTKDLITEVKRAGVFEVVTWTKVTQNPDLKSIQEEIAAWLGLDFKVDSTQIRAVRLSARLKQEEKVLVILDDLWKTIKLEDIGIPNDKDSKGCKILMTSRNRNVLLGMGAQKDFQLQILEQKEAWQLFQRTVDKVIDSDLEPTAKEVAERCAGLPVLITAVACALKGQQLNEWKDSLQQLKQFDHENIDDKVNPALKLSYNFLKEESKSVFLLCAQNGPHNIDIAFLLKYAIGLRIFKKCKQVEEIRVRLRSLVNELKASSLLFENKDGDLYMHDLVYSFAITDASEDQPIIASNGMEEWPEDDTLETSVVMVLNNVKVPRLPRVLNCPKLRFFQLNNEKSLEVGNDFFGGMKGLRVLNLKNTCFSRSVPASLHCLKDLQTLCLDSCVLNDITIIGDLEKLQVLSLVNCTIPCFPSEIGNLTQLRLLELKNCSSLEVFEPNVLSSLTSLEELYLENSFVNWEGSEGNNSQRKNASISELKHLSKLVTLHIHVVDAAMLPYDLPVKQLKYFRIFIGAEFDWSVEHKTSRTLKLNLNTINHLERVQGLLKNSEDLYLHDIAGVENVLNSSNMEGFPQLKHLLVQNSPDIKYIIDCRSTGHLSAFPCLESLSLDSLQLLEKICNAPLKMTSFGCLKKIKVGNCSTMKYLFSFSMFRGLQQLEEIDVNNCNTLKMIVRSGSNSDSVDEPIKLNKLQTLTLDHLPEFTSFCSHAKPTIAGAEYGEITAENENETPLMLFAEKIEFHKLMNLNLSSTNVKNIWSNQLKVAFQNLTSLMVDGCWNLSYLFTSSMVQHIAQLKKLEISNCSSMREIIATEGLEEEITRRKITFPKLEFLKLKHLPKLERFCSTNLLECPVLNFLRVENCLHLQTFVSSFVLTDMVGNSGARQPAETPLFDEKVSFPNLEEMHIFHMHRLGMIWNNEFLASGSFEKLKVLTVEHAKELLQLVPANMLIRGLRNLETLVVKNCDILEQVFEMEGVMQVKERLVLGLSTLDMRYLPKLKHVWNIGDNYDGMHSLPWSNLRSVTAEDCPSLMSLFPASIATDLLQLQVLDLSQCATLEELIAGGLETSPTFVFPKLKFLQLFRLGELRNFYLGTHTLECPVLESLWINKCEKLKVFSLKYPNFQEMHVKSKIEAQPLFYLTQVAPNLKQTTLSLEDARMIEQGQLPFRLFHKLEVVQLEYFNDESAYHQFDLLRRFQNIKQLIVSESNIEELFQCGDDQNVGVLFQIRSLRLNYLPNLRRIWNHGSLHKQVLQNLDTLDVLRCHGLTSLEPSFASFRNLQTLDLYECDGLMFLFKSAAAKSLVHLRTIIIKECSMVTEIVAVEGDETHTEITLSKLESLKLHCLESLSCFSLANCLMKFPSLTEVILTQCPKMKFFSEGNLYAPKLKKVYVTQETDKWRWAGNLNSTVQQMYQEMDGFHGIQELILSEFPELKEKGLAQLPVNFFYNLTTLVVDDCPFQFSAVPSNLLPFLIALEELEIRNCDILEELFGSEWPDTDSSFGYLSNLKEFQLVDLPMLRHVWDEVPKDMFDLKNLTLLDIDNCCSLRNVLTPTICSGLVQLQKLQVTNCEMVTEIIAATAETEDRPMCPMIVFPLLECIILEELPNLTSFYSATESVEFPRLKEISIAGCPLLNITHTIANSKVARFTHLKDLKPSSIDIQKILSCQTLTSLTIEGFKNLKFMFSASLAESLVQLKKVEISNCEMMEQVIETEGQEEQMTRHLKIDFLKLENLPKLARFISCDMLECSSLKELEIQTCPQLMAFVSSSTNSNAPRVIPSSLFDEKVAFPNLEQMRLIDMDNLRMIWNSRVHLDSFWKLETLKVKYNGELHNIFPHNMIERVQNLKNLVIKHCDSIEQVFDIHGVINAKKRERLTSQLKCLKIENLSNLRSIWNADPTAVVSFDELKSVYAWECPNLARLFPYSVAKSLKQLENLDLNNCGLVEIVSEMRVVEAAPEFIFPQLKSINLWTLESLKGFYRGMHTLDCPELETLSVYDCEKLKVFDQTTKNPSEVQTWRPLFLFSKIVPNLKQLSLTSMDGEMIKESQSASQLFRKLKVVELHNFHGESESSPFDLLKLFLKMEELHVRSAIFKELFPCEGLEHTLQTLKVLNVESCYNLITLAPSSVSLENLTTLDVNKCDKLLNLFTFKTAKCLVQLKTISVQECNMVTVIVANEGDESHTEITLGKLEKLRLHRLKSLRCFSSTTYRLNFPSLEEVNLTECPGMEFFSQGNIYTPQLAEVFVTEESEESEEWCWVGDLNTTIQQIYVDSVGYGEKL